MTVTSAAEPSVTAIIWVIAAVVHMVASRHSLVPFFSVGYEVTV